MKKGIIIIILCLFMTTSAEARGVATLYENGMDHFASGNNMFAFMAFREILRDHSSSEYADDAQFRIGEYYYREKSFSRAEKAFDQFLVKYPRSP